MPWLVLVALARTMVGRARPHLVGYLLAAAVGLTWASNAIGGGTEWFGLLVALAVVGWGWVRRRELGMVLLVGFVPSGVVLVAEIAGLA